MLPTLETLLSDPANVVAANAVIKVGRVPLTINLGQRGSVDGAPRCSYSEAYTTWASIMADSLWHVMEQQVCSTPPRNALMHPRVPL